MIPISACQKWKTFYTKVKNKLIITITELLTFRTRSNASEAANTKATNNKMTLFSDQLIPFSKIQKVK